MEEPTLDPSLVVPAQMTYRSTGLGVYAVAVRFCTMPLEKLAMIMNSAQVSGQGQLRQAAAIVFRDGLATPFRTVGPASVTAWFFQYSVMGFIFQLCDRALSGALKVEPVAYGEQLMAPPPARPAAASVAVSDHAKAAFKAVLAPALAGAIESGVANRAECQRFYGLQRFAHIEQTLNWGAAARQCGPGFVANASRNFVMSATSFVLTPTLYRDYVPQVSSYVRGWYVSSLYQLRPHPYALPRLRAAGAQVTAEPLLVRPRGQHLLWKRRRHHAAGTCICMCISRNMHVHVHVLRT